LRHTTQRIIIIIAMATQQAHFVPKTYLKGFCFDKKKQKVHAYNAKTGDVRPTSIDTICSQRYLYRVEDAAGQPSDEIEDFFAKEIEPRYQGWLNQIRNGKNLSNPDIADLAHYVAIQHLRVPTTLDDTTKMGESIFRESVNEEWAKLLDDDERKRVLQELEKEHPNEFAEFRAKKPHSQELLSREDIQNIIDGKGYDFKVDVGKNNIIKLMLESIPHVAEQIVASGWNFVTAPEGTEFLTSDMPCFVMIPTVRGAISFRHGGFGQPGAYVVLPLSKDICLVIEQGKYYQKFGVVTPRTVDEINQMTAEHSKQYLVGHTSSAVDTYIKTKSNKNV